MSQKSTFTFITKTILLGGFILFLLFIIVGSGGAAYVYFKYSRDLPDVRVLKDYQPSIITRIYSDQDELIGEFYVEKRILVPLDKIPLRLKQAALAVEDANFYAHHGIDPKAIIRAFISNLYAGRVVEGASTITQQLSKTFFLSRERNLERKVREAILSIRLEMVFSKDEILEMYLNQIYYGHGAYGVEAASLTYFGKHVQDLTIEECAMIAGLPKSPNYYSPYRNPKQAKLRRNHAIQRMAALGYISQEEATQAIESPFRLSGNLYRLNHAPYFVEYIRQFLEDTYGSSKIYNDGLNVYTTLSLKDQTIAQNVTREHLRETDKRYGYRGPIGHVNISQTKTALQQYAQKLNAFKDGEVIGADSIIKGIVVDVGDKEVRVFIGNGEGYINIENMNWARKPDTRVDGLWARIHKPSEALTEGDVILVKTLTTSSKGTWSLALEQEPEVEAGLLSLDRNGQIKAMIGGYDFSRSQFNRVMQAVRQPGSAFKPIIFATAISEGFTPASIIIDSPIVFKDKDGNFDDKWKPSNYEDKFYGPTSLRTALAHSRNVVTIKLLQSIGVRKTIDMAKSFGITSSLEENLSIALGSSGLTLYELTSAFSVFANNGKMVTPVAIRYIRDRNNEVIYSSKPVVTEVIPSGIAYVITTMLESVVQEGTGIKIKALKRPVAGKTGTTNNFVDAWFIGYTTDLLTGVWVGKDKDEPLGIHETGARTAIPVWMDYMKDVLEGTAVRDFAPPPDVTYVKTRRESENAASFDDPDAFYEVYLNDNLPERNTVSRPVPTTENAF